jgi:hypothetical protein
VAHVDADRIQAELERQRPSQAIEPPEGQVAPAARLASQIGNQGFTQAISRMRDGEGLLANGTVHPDVEATIAARRGRGSPLPGPLADRFAGVLGGWVKNVGVHTDATADALARSVSARAFATGNEIFFAHGEYRPDTPEGKKLIAHEVAHTEQQLNAPAVGPMNVSYPGDELEHRADVVAGELLA